MRILIIAGIFLLGACSTTAKQTDDVVTTEYKKIRIENQRASKEEKALCESVGGVVRPAGMAGWDHCIQDLPDAGLACSDTTDCLGRCIIPQQESRDFRPGEAASGVCEATDEVFGCTTLVNNGRIEGTLCVD